MNTIKQYSLGIIGVRGYVGKELLSLIEAHPQIQTQWLSSRQLEGQVANTLLDGDNNLDFKIEALTPEQVAARNTDIIVLALPNGLAEPYVKAIENNTNNQPKLIIDLSADYRFDEDYSGAKWIYSIPELDQNELKIADPEAIIKISNPGCYATAMQLALAPFLNVISGPAHCFGVSGYSGAGTNPSPNNDPENLNNNLIGYKLVEHLHEKEVSKRLSYPIRFSPHVAAFFRGINMTLQIEFDEAQIQADLFSQLTAFYKEHPLVKCQDDIPVVKDVINTPFCIIGGITISEDGKRATLVSCLDNLLKGAASQALQNINIVLGINSLTAVETIK